MKWQILMLTFFLVFDQAWSNPPRSYRVTLEKISLVESGSIGGSDNLYGSVWVGAFCNANDNKTGTSFDSRERTLKLFERTGDNYVKIKENTPIVLNQSLVFDIPTCDQKQANFAVTVSLSSQSSGRKYNTEQHRIYLSEINSTVRRTIHCYDRTSHLQLHFMIAPL